MTGPHALISGAGIAGPALAHQLTARGWRTTVVERYPRRRDEGQNIDVRGAAREVVRRMGIDADIRAANTGEIGMRLVRADGSAAASFPINEHGQIDGPTAELEILRGELSRILYEHTRADTDYRFDTRIRDLTDHGDHVTTVLDDGAVLDTDVVVIAEGLRSPSRRFVTAAEVTDVGMYFAYLTIPRQDTDDPWWNWIHAPGSRAVHLRPDNLGTTRAILTFLSEVRGLETLNRAEQISILRRTFDDLGGPTPRVLAELDDAALYFDAVGQFRCPTWSKGRVGLLGDAAFCNATFGGAGTSLALIGAYLLAGELAHTGDHRAAFTRYEHLMRPITDAVPRVRLGILRLANPRTRAGIHALHTGARLAATPLIRATMTALGTHLVNVAEDIDLPDHSYPSPLPGSAYVAPSWWETKLSGLFARTNIAERLTVIGRVSGNPRHVAVATVDVDGVKYLVSARGQSQWVKNIRAHPDVTLTVRGCTRTYTATEVPPNQQAPIVAAKFGKRGVGRFSTTMPDPADHPTFALTPHHL